MKSYTPWIIVACLVVIALIGWVIFSHSSTTPPVAQAPVPTPVIIASPAPSASSTPSLPVYTLADIAQHSTAASCWLAIDGNVYDVTSFVPMHPGGPAILKGCGKDASALFHSVPQHAEENVLTTVAPKYLIGLLATTSATTGS